MSQTMGVESPSPGMPAFHLTFWVSLQVTGGSAWGASPVKSRPPPLRPKQFRRRIRQGGGVPRQPTGQRGQEERETAVNANNGRAGAALISQMVGLGLNRITGKPAVHGDDGAGDEPGSVGEEPDQRADSNTNQ